jgi:3-polyprenyl-4-hydroxybenzoate decarboxylase
MAYKEAREWLETLERENELARITTPVHRDLEMGGISVCTGV